MWFRLTQEASRGPASPSQNRCGLYPRLHRGCTGTIVFEFLSFVVLCRNLSLPLTLAGLFRIHVKGSWYGFPITDNFQRSWCGMQIARLLLAYGADINAEDKSGTKARSVSHNLLI